jgi:hypothetical protein
MIVVTDDPVADAYGLEQAGGHVAAVVAIGDLVVLSDVPEGCSATAVSP